MASQDRRPRVPNRDLVAAALRSEGFSSRVPRLAGVSPNELSLRLRDSARFHDEFEAALAAAWAAAHGGKMPDGSDAMVLVEQMRERLDQQRATTIATRVRDRKRRKRDSRLLVASPVTDRPVDN